MEYSRRIDVLVHERSSRRSFREQQLTPAHRRRLEQELRAPMLRSGAFGAELRFELVAATPEDADALRGLHTYGFVSHPAGFLVGAVRPGRRELEDYGRALELLVLLATELGVGTCWLGGTFNRSRFAERIAVAGDETIPAVIALGYATEVRGGVERLIRWGAGAHKRLPWSEKFFDGRYGAPLDPDPAAWWHEPLELVRLAPSASNRQPARVVRDGERFHFLVARSRGYAQSMQRLGLADLQRVDLGIAMCHFELGAEAAGHHGAWTIEDDAPAPLPEGVEYTATWRPVGG